MSRLHDEHAQGVVEFAIIAMVLVVLFLGVIDFSRYAYYKTTIDGAARVGAETASNHCPSIHNCFLTTATPDDYVIQATVCEASPYVKLKVVVPLVSCNPCGPTWTACADPFGSAGAAQACPSQNQDVCVATDTSSTGCSLTHSCVTVSVGYDFQTVSFYLSSLFTSRSCWTGDDPTSNSHTLCDTVEGRVS